MVRGVSGVAGTTSLVCRTRLYSRLTPACSCCTIAAPAPHANRNAMVTRTQVVPRSGIVEGSQDGFAPRPVQLSSADPDFLPRCSRV
jgi:hypothetical protein